MREYTKAILISFVCYLIFFYPLLDKDTILYSGKDSSTFHYPSRVYLYEKLKSREFPYWTEKMYLGFPIYADLERGYLNPINIVSVYLLGPFLSFKIIHFVTYLIGSLSLYVLLKKLGHNLIGFLLANLVYFFSFFLLYHQQHFNAVLTLYLLPLLILLTQNFLETKKKKYILLISLLQAYTFYLGNMQYVLLSALAQIIWIMVSGKRDRSVYYLFIFQYFLVFVISLPGLVSVFGLYESSLRNTETNLYNQGSFFPLMFLNALVPFLFGRGSAYSGILISDEYFMHEIYIYLGIAGLVVSVLFYLTSANIKLKKFVSAVSILFLVLSIIKYIPLLNNNPLLPFSLFRYWMRSVVLFSFGVALMISEFFSSKSLALKFLKKESLYILSALLFLFTIELLNFANGNSKTFLRIFLRNDYKFDNTFVLWLLILFFTITVVFLYYKKKLSFRNLKTFLASLIILDTVFLGSIVTGPAFRNISDILPQVDVSENEDLRVLDFKKSISGDNSLYFKSWSPFGYSVFVPTDIKNRLTGLGFKDTRYLDLEKEVNSDAISDLGFSKIISTSETYTNNITFPLKSKAEEFALIKKSEQEYVFIVKVEKDEILDTYIRFDEDWQVYSDGGNVDSFSEHGFLSFNIRMGRHLINIKYVPLGLYASVACSSLLFIVYLVFFTRKSIAKKLDVQ